MSSLSDEERINRAALAMGDPYSRRVFVKLAAAAGVALVPGLATLGCGADEAADAPGAAAAAGGKTGTVVNNIATLANDYWADWDKGFKGATDALSCPPKTLLHDYQPTRELSQIRGLRSVGGDMVIGTPSSAGAVPALARLCQQQKVYYAPTWESPAWFTPQDVGDYFVTFMTPPSELAAYEAAKVLFESIDGDGKVIHVKGLAGPTDTFRTTGVERAAREFPGVKLVGGLRANWTREEGRSKTLNSLSAHPDARAVFAQNDSIALGVLSVLDERALKDVKVAGIDGLEELLPRLEQGRNFVASHNSLGVYQAGFSVVNVFDALNGWKPSTPERLLYTGSVLLTQDNVTDLRKKLYGGKSPFDWRKMSRTLNKDTWDPQNEITPIDPDEHWKVFKKDLPLNAEWAKAKTSGEIDRVKQLYADRYKTGPLKA